MSTDRGQRPTGRKRQRRDAAESRAARVRLAPGVRLDGGGQESPGVYVLVCPSGDVQLNEGAAAILLLCDGSRGREDIVREVVRRSGGGTLASDIVEFLDAARARGWIIES